MAATRIRYSPELQDAIIEQAHPRQCLATRSPRLRPMAVGRPISTPDTRFEAHGGLFRAYDSAVREAVSGLADRFIEVLVSPAWAASEEGAEVSEDRSTLGLRVLPVRFADPLELKRFLCHELGHVIDILDATFGYGAGVREGLAVTQALRRRFSLFWDCSIDGRIARTGRAPLHTRKEYEAECVRLFPGLPGDVPESAVGRLWEGERPPYCSLVHMAADLATHPDALSSISRPIGVARQASPVVGE